MSRKPATTCGSHFLVSQFVQAVFALLVFAWALPSRSLKTILALGVDNRAVLIVSTDSQR